MKAVDCKRSYNTYFRFTKQVYCYYYSVLLLLLLLLFYKSNSVSFVDIRYIF